MPLAKQFRHSSEHLVLTSNEVVSKKRDLKKKTRKRKNNWGKSQKRQKGGSCQERERGVKLVKGEKQQQKLFDASTV